MKIEVERIKNREIELTEEVSASSWKMDSFDIKFVDNIHLDCTFVRVEKEIIVDTEVITNRIVVCSRCLEKVKQTTKQAFKLVYESNNCGDYLDIDNDIREEVLLNFPMKVLCKSDCKGICPHCGINLTHQKCQCEKLDLSQKSKG
jgi:uncharacterized protein